MKTDLCKILLKNFPQAKDPNFWKKLKAWNIRAEKLMALKEEESRNV